MDVTDVGSLFLTVNKLEPPPGTKTRTVRSPVASRVVTSCARSGKHYYLMDQGDFIVQFMDLCEPELQKNISDILPTKLENLLGETARNLSQSYVGN